MGDGDPRAVGLLPPWEETHQRRNCHRTEQSGAGPRDGGRLTLVSLHNTGFTHA